ncbi:conserved hypothetical protein [Talaromyces stipitatus ATCC 10500]|uniref:Nicotinamide riboside kinase n=1 Tax=Talaromyces stipitatus (strain ATCC 10500 / CBS 375.48 / QM 6759 / NRRL 1006) TaxID=441959 RepID=B8LWN6_TALSN|nr:uncharacterized protein TSTA_077950 [Talaromyces stipitatus ATCC 10500]EED24433.1 conserved hypothetical protein [Talaromyces stipitatus ATCC 10500]
MSTDTHAGQSSTNKTIIIGLSGPSSSGKTTLARLLRPIFAVDDKIRTFIVHEDDFYRPDDQIPVVRTKKGDLVQDWDTIGAIDVDFLSSALAYVREHGTLPPRLRSKEDQNEAKDPGVAQDLIQKIAEEVNRRLKQTLLKDEAKGNVTIAFLEGFLLFAPPASENPGHVLRHVHDNIHLHIFLSAPYDTVKSRREARSGYVTIGPAPTPAAERENSEEKDNIPHKGPSSTVDLEKEDDSEPQSFWTDPPGYVDDIVWPRYVQDHAWLLAAEDDEMGGQSLADRYAASPRKTDDELLRLAGQAVNIRSDAGVVVAPGKGEKPMSEILRWAVDEILNYLKA